MSNTIKITRSAGVVALLAGVGVLIWALAFRGEGNKAAANRLPTPQVSRQSIAFPTGRTSVDKVFGQLNTASLVAAAGVVAAGDVLEPRPSAASLEFSLHGFNASGFGTAGKSQLETAPLTAAAGLVAAGDALAPRTGVERLHFDASALTRKTVPLRSVAGAGDVLLAGASLAPSDAFRYTLHGASVPGSKGVSQFKTAPMVSAAGLTSPAEVLMAQATYSGETFAPSGK